jgi:hypothetical protein
VADRPEVAEGEAPGILSVEGMNVEENGGRRQRARHDHRGRTDLADLHR